MLQDEQKKAESLIRGDVLALPQFIFSYEDHVTRCSRCGKPLHVRGTERRKVFSTAFGPFIAVERQGYCPAHPDVPVARSQQLAHIIAPGAEYAYDVLVRVGLARFVECRQCDEIRTELSHHYGIEVPVSTISYLARKFIAYFQEVHRESIELLRADMQCRGGYILHVDGTCEEGSGVLLVCLDSLSGQILDSQKIGSENHDEIQGVLQEIRRDWGIPLAIVHDLRRSIITAAGEVFPEAPQFVCHYHLAADVGKDILSTHEDRLRRLFRRTKIRPKLGSLIRSLKGFAVCPQNGKHRVDSVLGLRSPKKLRLYCEPEVAKGVAHALASWILAFSQDGEGYGFPFDLPYLNLYQRIVNAHHILQEACPTSPDSSRDPLGAFHRLREILDPIVTGHAAAEFREIVGQTQTDRKIFERFRSALRICPKGGKHRRNDPGEALSAKRHKTVLEKLRTALEKKSRSESPSQEACAVVVRHLDKYWDHLFGHVLVTKGQKIIVPRTNNVQEGRFRLVKRQCRRLHGRGHLSRDIDAMPPTTPLVLNLKNSAYCQTVYGGKEPEKIAAVFSRLDPKVVARSMENWRQERLLTTIPQHLKNLDDFPRQVAPFISMAEKVLRKQRKI